MYVVRAGYVRLPAGTSQSDLASAGRDNKTIYSVKGGVTSTDCDVTAAVAAAAAAAAAVGDKLIALSVASVRCK